MTANTWWKAPSAVAIPTKEMLFRTLGIIEPGSQQVRFVALNLLRLLRVERLRDRGLHAGFGLRAGVTDVGPRALRTVFFNTSGKNLAKMKITRRRGHQQE